MFDILYHYVGSERWTKVGMQGNLPSAKRQAERIAKWNLVDGWEWNRAKEPNLIRGTTKDVPANVTILVIERE